ncbi:MAG TPA: HIT domain-containing protein [Actinomycetota bacterium]|nr:HIT domain-containing protein [Actinomycetota bacterium]
MERLWSPWRMEYIRSARRGDDAGCLFCDLVGKGDDEEALILARTDRAFAVLNAYPYNAGHLMVAPLRHVGRLEELDEEEVVETQRLLQRALGALREVAEPDGFNLGMNLGRVAGAGVPDHAHWHVVPRWDGDTNFMPVVGDTKVLPELLAETYGKLQPAFERA